MLVIKNLYKEKKNIVISNINLSISEGSMASIDCRSEVSEILINLIIGKEMPAQGEIYINNELNTQYIKTGLKNIGIIFSKEGFYERLTVKEYMKFFSQILNSSSNYNDVMRKLALLDIGDVKTSHLSYSQKKRLSFARERLKDLKLLIFQEPILNMERDSARIVLKNIEELRNEGVAVLNTSVSFKDTILLGGQTYNLDENGMREIQQDIELEDQTVNTYQDTYKRTRNKSKNDMKESDVDKSADKPMYKIEKIPAKIAERVLLFNPIEIDYIESEQGISYLNVRGEKFTCMLALNELEDRLKHFGFFRCHRSYLVNLQEVREIVTWTRNSYSLTLDDKNKSSVPLSKGRMDELKSILSL